MRNAFLKLYRNFPVGLIKPLLRITDQGKKTLRGQLPNPAGQSLNST